jgi:hypothetical protein
VKVCYYFHSFHLKMVDFGCWLFIGRVAAIGQFKVTIKNILQFQHLPTPIYLGLKALLLLLLFSTCLTVSQLIQLEIKFFLFSDCYNCVYLNFVLQSYGFCNSSGVG